MQVVAFKALAEALMLGCKARHQKEKDDGSCECIFHSMPERWQEESILQRNTEETARYSISWKV